MAYVRACVCACVYAYVYLCEHASVHVCMSVHAYKLACVSVCVCVRVRPYLTASSARLSLMALTATGLLLFIAEFSAEATASWNCVLLSCNKNG